MRIPVSFHFSHDYGTLIGEPVVLGLREFASNTEYKKVLDKVKKEYDSLINRARREDLKSALEIFLERVSEYAIVDSSFIECVARDLGVEKNDIFKLIISSDFIRNRVETVKKSFRKLRKDDPIEYAESVGLLVSLLGLKVTHQLMKINKIKIGKSTLESLYKISIMRPEVKKLIKDGRLLLTIAFEIPLEYDIEFANELVDLSYSEARKKIKRLKKDLN